MSIECKELEQQAKQKENEDLQIAIQLYKEAAICYKGSQNEKEEISNFEKAAKLLKEKAKSIEDPEEAFMFYSESAQIFEDIGKERDAAKIKEEAKKTFIKSAKNLRKEAQKMDDIEKAEQQLAIASKYFIQGGEEEEHRNCWIDSADKFFKAATDNDDPLEAFELFKHAARNYRRGGSEENESKSILESASKFYRKGLEIHKDNTNLIMGYYYLSQASNICIYLADPEKQVTAQEKAGEIQKIIGLPDELLLSYLESQDMFDVSISIEDSITPTDFEMEPPYDEPSTEDYEEMHLKPRITSQNPPEPISHSEPVLEEDMIDSTNVYVSTEPSLTPEMSMDVMESEPNEGVRDSDREEFLEDRIKEIPESYPAERLEPENKLSEPMVHPIDEVYNSGSAEEKEVEVGVETQYMEKEITPESPIHEISPELVQEDTSPNIKAPDPNYILPQGLIDILKTQGYLNSSIIEKDKLQEVPEYQILSIIVQNYPISLEYLESMTDLPSISLVLSNLSADGLVEQTESFEYTISKLAKKQLD